MNPLEHIALLYIQAIKNFRLLTVNLLCKTVFVKKQNYQRILINRDGAFGDSIVALPAISIIRQNFPDSKIDLLSVTTGGITFNDIGLNGGLLDKLIVINKKQRMKVLKSLRGEGYDLFIQLPQNLGLYKSIRNIILVRFYLGIKSGFGWDAGRIKSCRQIQKKYLDIPTERNRFIKILNDNDLYGELDYPISEKKPEALGLNDHINSQNLLAFLIGGKLQVKKWPLQHWVSLANKLGGDFRLLIIGGDNEKAEAEYILSKTENATDLCGNLTIPELFYLLKKVQVAISLDTGAMHLCDAANTKMVALFSNHELSNKWFPNQKDSIVMECESAFSENNESVEMKNIQPKDVYENVLKLLSNK